MRAHSLVLYQVVALRGKINTTEFPMKHYTVTFQPDRVSVSIHAGATLLEAASQVDIVLNASCGAQGTCGKCTVHIQPEDIPVLACQHIVDSDITVSVPDTSRFYRQQILLHGIDRQMKLSPNITKIYLPEPPDIKDLLAINISEIESHIHPLTDNLTQLYAELSSSGGEQGLTAVLHQLPHCTKSDANCYNYLTFERGDTTSRLFGIAVDIGTTTVVAKLLDFATGNCIATAATENPQIRFGDDVISRVAYAQSDEQLNEIHQVIINALNTLIGELCQKASVSSDEIYEMVLAGNTAMNHIFLEFPVKQLGQAPYEPYSTKSHLRSAAEMNLNINQAGSIYTIENIAGFIGADTTAAALAVGMDLVTKMTLLVDIGTNGELVLGTKDKMYAASCAAGPALEGARITQGSRAVEGAIEAVVINDQDIDIDVIGFKPPASICGSGLIDALAVLLELGVVDYTGAFAETDKIKQTLSPAIFNRLTEHKGERAFRLTDNTPKGLPEVLLTQRDVRQTQLAKGAIRAGIQLLVQKMGITEKDIDQILLAGAFGNYIRRESACRIGLLPNLPIERIHFVGNAASSGAQLALLSGSSRQTARDLAEKIEYIELAHEMDFQMFFADAMLFD